MQNLEIIAISGSRGRRIPPRRFRSEARLRRFVVHHARVLLELTVLATEYPIATNGGGRIDALGLDRNRNPVVIEFKRTASGTAICQGLYYLDWLDHHRDVFSTLVTEQLGTRDAARIGWGNPRLICLAEEIGEREEAVARQIGRPVELLQIRRIPHGLVLIQRCANHAGGEGGARP